MTRSRYITRPQMDALTERILVDYGFDPHQKLIQAVPIEELVEFHFDLQLCWEPIDHLDADGVVMGALFPEQRQVVLNETHRDLFVAKPGTYHFTLAHELGHWVLHTTETPYMLREHAQQAGKVPPYKPPEEVQADLFAGCLLLPQPMLARAIGQCRKLGRIQLHQLYKLADCFRVSISALTVRLAQLDLLYVSETGSIQYPGQSRQEQVQLQLDL